MQVTILGIIDNTVYIQPFYAGDHAHQLIVTSCEKADFIKHGAVEYPSYDYIEAQLYGKTYDEYMEYIAEMNREYAKLPESQEVEDSPLPF